MLKATPLLAIAALAAPASAQTIVGGSDLLTTDDVVQLAEWLGESPALVLTNVFDWDGVVGSKTSADFHAACDQYSRTICVYRESNTGMIIGGYNPLPWHTGQQYNTGFDPAAWIFNLTTDVKQEQVLHWQTYHHQSYGPTFGGGHDIYMLQSLSAGYVNAHSYGPGNPGHLNILGNQGFTATDYDGLEIFTISYENEVGTNYCSTNANSTGDTGKIMALGSDVVADNDLTLFMHDVPVGEFGYFLNAPAQDFVANPGGAAGNLCLGGKIGRHSAQIGLTQAPGYLAISVDVNALPRPMMGPHAIQPGETWYFQGWFRDGATSNMTDATSVLFQ